MNNLQSALMSLMASVKIPHFPHQRGKTIKALLRRETGDGNKKSGKTRKGAVHKQGKVFRSKMRTQVPAYLLNPDAPKSAVVFVTPAQYRHLHLGVTKKKKQGV